MACEHEPSADNNLDTHREGMNGSANGEAGNLKRRRVNMMWVYEDNDRDDADGPPGCDASFQPAHCVEGL
jgi:hypothetical protein